MKADRLIAIVMLLKRYGTVSAGRLARELEVSRRTIYRDIDALGMAGIPVYSSQGSAGGYSIMEGFDPQLSELNSQEVLAVMLAAKSPALEGIGMGKLLTSAMRKLDAADGSSANTLEQRIYFEPDSSGEAAPLAALRQAVFEDRRTELIMRWPPFLPEQTIVLDPLALVESHAKWFLVARLKGFARVYPVEAFTSCTVLDTSFTRPENFSLPNFWAWWKKETENTRPVFPVSLSVSEEAFSPLARELNTAKALLQQAARPDGERFALVVEFSSREDARRFALSNGDAVRITAPMGLKMSVAAFSRRTAAMYRNP